MATEDPIAEKTQEIAEHFRRQFEASGRVFQAPGRVNLIGEHTDYNDGFAMPTAIGFSTRVAGARREDRRLIVSSANFAEQVSFDLESLPTQRAGHWSDYVVGVASQLQQALRMHGGEVSGANLLLHGDVPQGAGLSSSASLEVAVCYALSNLSEVPDSTLDRKAMALLCQRAENEFVGASCGVMDQFVSCFGRAGHTLLLDCRSLEFEALPLPASVSLVICNSMVRHTVADGEYGSRRRQCEEGVAILKRFLPGITALRDVTLEQLKEFRTQLSNTVFRRCRHIITENERVEQAGHALRAADLVAFGKLMAEAFASYRDDFEASCPEVDVLVKLANQCEGVLGARLTGGGFGGCTVNLVEKEFVGDFRRKVGEGYERATGLTAEIYICEAADGVKRLL